MDAAHDLEALAKRVEAAAGPDRELDWGIDACIRPDQYRGIQAADELGHPLEWLSDEDLPRYTASLDAAMSLVPEGHTVQLSDWDHAALREEGPWQAIVLPMGARGSMADFTFTNRCDHAASPALALAAASLRALSQGVNDDR